MKKKNSDLWISTNLLQIERLPPTQVLLHFHWFCSQKAHFAQWPYLRAMCQLHHFLPHHWLFLLFSSFFFSLLENANNTRLERNGKSIWVLKLNTKKRIMKNWPVLPSTATEFLYRVRQNSSFSVLVRPWNGCRMGVFHLQIEEERSFGKWNWRRREYR